MSKKQWRTIWKAEDVTPEILEMAESISEGWFSNGPRIDWHDFLDRLDGMTLDDGNLLDLGDNQYSSAIMAIKVHLLSLR